MPTSREHAGPTVLQVGILDDLYVVRFHAKERRNDGLHFRWTTNQSYVVIANFGPGARSVTVWLSSGGRPPTVAPPTADVLLDDQVLGTATPVDQVQPYTFAIPAALAEAAAAKEDPPRLMLRVPTWHPHDARGVADAEPRRDRHQGGGSLTALAHDRGVNASPFAESRIRGRGLVRAADARSRRSADQEPGCGPARRLLLLRLERIGDPVMGADGIATAAAEPPDAEIDLVVGSWNASLAALILASLAWKRSTRRGSRAAPAPRPERPDSTTARTWRERRHDPRSTSSRHPLQLSVVSRLRGASAIDRRRRRIPQPTATDYEPSAHVATNAVRLARRHRRTRESIGGWRPGAARPARFRARRDAARLLDQRTSPIVGVHTSGGRAIKQWPPERFRELARRLIDERDATIVLTGGDSDRELVRAVKADLPPSRVVDLCGTLDLTVLAAVIERLDLFVTGDTGPMHVAHAVGTPTVSIFGPSDPIRYARRDPQHRVVRIDLPCSPCNRIRGPPARCTGHTPDCLAGVTVDLVQQAVDEALAVQRNRAAHRTRALG